MLIIDAIKRLWTLSKFPPMDIPIGFTKEEFKTLLRIAKNYPFNVDTVAEFYLKNEKDEIKTISDLELFSFRLNNATMRLNA